MKYKIMPTLLIASLLAGAIGLSLLPARGNAQAARLAFNADGSIKILQITDIHWKDGGTSDIKSLALVRELVEKEDPDVLVLTGDIVYGKKCPNPKEGLDRIIAIPI